MLLSRPLHRSPYICASCTRRLATALSLKTRHHASKWSARSITTNALPPHTPRALTTSSIPRTRRNAYSTAQTSRGRLRVAIIGSGPAGFYTAHRLLNKTHDAVIDMYEQLPVPYGLVRFGVAPDHPEVKNCQDTFEEVAQSPRFNYIGNVRVGHDVELMSMKPHYDAILFSYGASEDRELGIPGENLRGVLSARSFVGWYNGLPQFQGLSPNLKVGEQAVVVGQGNVALDVARILLSPVDKLAKTDISEQALQCLAESRVRSVRVVGRRGPIQVCDHSPMCKGYFANMTEGRVYSQRSPRAHAHTLRRVLSHRPLLLPTRNQESRPRAKTHSRSAPQGHSGQYFRTSAMGPRLLERTQILERRYRRLPLLHNLHSPTIRTRRRSL
jgi:adrenodoxin-NADP+ reductase